MIDAFFVRSLNKHENVFRGGYASFPASCHEIEDKDGNPIRNLAGQNRLHTLKRVHDKVTFSPPAVTGSLHLNSRDVRVSRFTFSAR